MITVTRSVLMFIAPARQTSHEKYHDPLRTLEEEVEEEKEKEEEEEEEEEEERRPDRAFVINLEPHKMEK